MFLHVPAARVEVCNAPNTMMTIAPAAAPALFPHATALVTGASSGVGLAIVEWLLSQAGTSRVVAVARGATTAASLRTLQAQAGARLLCHDVDITDPEALQRLAAALAAIEQPLQLVVNAAGLLHADGLRPEKSIRDVSRAALQRVFALNAFAPLLLAQAVLPFIPTAAPAVFASLSARVGSIGDNQLGGWYAYRASKAAQNQLLRTLAIELRRTHPQLACVCLHPGTVDTPLSKPFQRGVPPDRLFTPGRAAAQLMRVIGELGPQHSGSFLAWDGSPIPW
jgi:NAD(P)-dependent dehydrogenase (short-subunit alcohol dehydrogenase family)